MENIEQEQRLAFRVGQRLVHVIALGTIIGGWWFLIERLIALIGGL